MNEQASRGGVCLEVAINVARVSEVLDEVECMKDEPIPLPISSECLRKCIEFSEHYLEEPMSPIQTPLKSVKLPKWYDEFVDLPQKQLFELLAAASYLGIKALLDLTALKVAILIKVCHLHVTFAGVNLISMVD